MNTKPMLRQDGKSEFYWNGRRCLGTKLHYAIYECDLDEVKRLLQSGEASASEAFTFKYPGGSTGTCFAIHLAASLGAAGEPLEIITEDQFKQSK